MSFFTLNASTFTDGSLGSGDIGCSLNSSTNNTPSVTISGNTQINPYPSTGIAYSSICFWGGLAVSNVIPIYGSYGPGGGTMIVTASGLNSMGIVLGVPGRYFIGQTLIILFYSNQTYSNDYVWNRELPNQFVIPAPPGGSNNIYGGIQTSTTFVVQPCGTPTGLSGVNYQNSQVLLSWTAPTDDGGSAISNYRIQYNTTGSAPWSELYTGSSSTSYTVPNLSNGTTYYFQVAAVNGYCNNGTGYGPDSGLFSTTASAFPATTPSQVTGVSTTSGPLPGNIVVSWGQPNTGGSPITSYTLQYRVSGTGGWTTIPSIGTTPTNYTITGLANGTTYDIQVAAVNIPGQGPYSNIVIGVTFGAPQSPTGLSGQHGNAQVILTWTPGYNGGTPITGYLVERSTSSSGPWTQLPTGSTTPSYTAIGLTNGTLYFFRVSGINVVGTGPPSTQTSVTPSTTPGPAIITSSASCDNRQVLVTWSSTSPPVDTGGAPILSYNVQYSTSATGESWLTPTPSSVTAPTTSYTFTGLTNGIPYYFQVQAENMNGVGPYSSQTPSSTAISSITPQAPSPITTTAITSSSISLSWTAPTNTGGNPVTGYYIYWSQVSSTGTIVPPINSYDTTSSVTPPATTYTITGLTYATLYGVQISSISCSGVGPISAPTLYVTTSSIPPSAPTNVTISGCNSGYTDSVILTWTAPVDNGGSPITNYIVYYRTTSSVGTWYTYNTNSNATTAIVPLPSSNTSYDFKVAAQNIAGASVFSSPIISSSSYNPPTSPTNLVSTNLVSNTSSNGSIVLSWSPSSQEGSQTISYYVIEYKICEFGGWITYPATIPHPTTTTTLNNIGASSSSNIANNLPYLFRVYAVNSCGARSVSTDITSAVSYNNSEPTRLWPRFNINCAGNITSFDTLTRNMLRKAEVLQYPGVGNLQYSRATLWSMAAKNQLSRKKTWASQSEEYTYPNTTNINNQPGVGLRQTPTSLVCWTPPPTIICNPASSSNVPGNNTTLCFSKNAPFNNFKKPITYASGGTKWPVFFSK
jgi:hypothetical protein